jgi:hypothetical protein
MCRYDRILFASDADPDGGNINSSLISMFLEFYRPLVDAGMVYVTLPPLFVVKDGSERVYCQDESERDAAVAQMKATSKRKVEVQRNKGLGEMDADDFWHTVLDPQRRTVIRVHPDGGEKKLHHTLFGGPPEGRRSWMADIAALSRLEPVERGGDRAVADAVEREGQLVSVPVVVGALVEHQVGVLVDDGGHGVLLAEVECRGVDTGGALVNEFLCNRTHNSA